MLDLVAKSQQSEPMVLILFVSSTTKDNAMETDSSQLTTSQLEHSSLELPHLPSRGGRKNRMNSAVV